MRTCLVKSTLAGSSPHLGKWFIDSTNTSLSSWHNSTCNEKTDSEGIPTVNTQPSIWHINSSTTDNTHFQWHFLPPSPQLQPRSYNSQSNPLREPQFRTPVFCFQKAILVYSRTFVFWKDNISTNPKRKTSFHPTYGKVLPIPRIRRD